MTSSESKTALLVGSSGLLGPVWHEALVDMGLAVLTADLTDANADIQLDLRDSSSILEMCQSLPQIDIVVLNAGVDAKLDHKGLDSLVGKLDLAQWGQFFQVNVIAQAELIDSILPKLTQGSIVIGIGSIYALVAPRIDVYNPPGGSTTLVKHPAYGASKAAFASLFRQYAIQNAGKTSFNLLTLGVVDGDQPDHFKSIMPTHIPNGVFLDKTKLGKHLQTLIAASDPNFTGQNIIVDGGYTLW